MAALVLAVGAACADRRVAEVNAATRQLESDVVDYLRLAEREPPTTDPEWEAFFSERDERLVELRASLDRWSGAYDGAVRAGKAPEGDERARLEAYRDALADWIAVQEEEARLTRPCFTTARASVAAAFECYQRLLREKGPEWQAAEERVRELAGRQRQ